MYRLRSLLIGRARRRLLCISATCSLRCPTFRHPWRSPATCRDALVPQEARCTRKGYAVVVRGSSPNNTRSRKRSLTALGRPARRKYVILLAVALLFAQYVLIAHQIDHQSDAAEAPCELCLTAQHQSSTPISKDIHSKPHRRFTMRLYDRCTSTLRLRLWWYGPYT